MQSNNRKFKLQDDQYSFPYHHIPNFDKRTGAGISVRTWSYGVEYLCYHQHIIDLVDEIEPQSLLDVGCGEGRFLGLLGPRVPNKMGIELSERAIQWAQAFHPEIKFEIMNASELTQSFDMVTAIEVLEHIPDDETSNFIQSLVSRTLPGGKVLISVPAIAMPLIEKHYRHYDLNLLQQQVASATDALSLVRADYVYPHRQPFLFRTLMKLMQNKWWKLDIYALRKPIWDYLWKRRICGPSNGRHLVALFERR